jgi:hypothetical protein
MVTQGATRGLFELPPEEEAPGLNSLFSYEIGDRPMIFQRLE